MAIWNPDEYETTNVADAAANVIEEMAQEQASEAQQVSEAAEVLNEAIQRIEEANLFRELIKNPVFAPGSASPQILESVNSKIRNFALKELRNLLGMESKEQEEVKSVKVTLPFDEDEIRALKTLSAQVNKKAGVVSAQKEFTPQIIQIEKNAEPLLKKTPALQNLKQTLNTTAPTPKPKAPPAAAKPASNPRAAKKRKGHIPMPTETQMLHNAALHVPSSNGEMGALISRLTAGASSVHIDDSDPADSL